MLAAFGFWPACKALQVVAALRVIARLEMVRERRVFVRAFVVEVQLSTPVVLTPWKHVPVTLDGILYACLCRSVPGGAPGLPPMAAEELREFIPLDREVLGSEYVFACSLPHVELADRFYYAASVSKRQDWPVLAGVRRFYTASDMNVGSGSYQMAKETFAVVAVKALRFYARGDLQKTAELLDRARAVGMGVGRMRRIGFGRIAGIRLAPLKPAGDLSVFDPSGRPTRPVPSDWVSVPGVPRLVAATLPPYWSPDSVKLCAMPDPGVWLWC